MAEDKLYELAVSFQPFTEKDRVKRTADIMKAILELQEHRDVINTALAKLQSGEVLSEDDADPILNTNVPAVSSLMRPHALERHWKVRNDKANKLLKEDKRKQEASQGSWRPKPYKPARKLEAAKAFKAVFTVKTTDWFKSEKPSEAWVKYFTDHYNAATEDDTNEED